MIEHLVAIERAVEPVIEMDLDRRSWGIGIERDDMRDAIPIERRSASEVFGFGAVRTAPEGISADNPAFDVTPAKYITAIITERGVLRAPFTESIAALALHMPELSPVAA